MWPNQTMGFWLNLSELISRMQIPTFWDLHLGGVGRPKMSNKTSVFFPLHYSLLFETSRLIKRWVILKVCTLFGAFLVVLIRYHRSIDVAFCFMASMTALTFLRFWETRGGKEQKATMNCVLVVVLWRLWTLWRLSQTPYLPLYST